MTWSYTEAKRSWLETEAGKFLTDNKAIIPRVRSMIERHYVYQYNPWSGNERVWKMEGTIEELELIANDERPIVGIGDVGRKNLQEVLLNEVKEREQ